MVNRGMDESHFKYDQRSQLKVVYFTIVPLISESNGGGICCRNHILRMHEDPGLQLSVIAAGPSNREAGTLEFFRSNGIDGQFIPYKPTVRDAAGRPPAGSLPWCSEHWPFLGEVEGFEQRHVDDALRAYAEKVQADCIVIDYLPSCYVVPRLLTSSMPVVTITLNREAEFYEDLLRLGAVLYGRPTSRIAAKRLHAFEAEIYRRSKAVVTIGKYDHPHPAPGRPAAVWMPPTLPPKPVPWQPSNSRTLFFVGNRGHFPNGVAIEWLVTQFAPELEALDPTIELAIIGARSEDVPGDWHRPSVTYLGLSDRPTLDGLFRSAGAMIAPIANTYGAKFKVAEAISYGTPILAPESALSGVSFLPWLPRIRLDQPREAAIIAMELVNDVCVQRSMSVRMLDDAAAFRASPAASWSHQLRTILSE